MRPSKNQRHIDRLQRLLDRVDASNTATGWASDQGWLRRKIHQLEKQLISLTKDDKIKANRMWARHN